MPAERLVLGNHAGSRFSGYGKALPQGKKKTLKYAGNRTPAGDIKFQLVLPTSNSYVLSTYLSIYDITVNIVMLFFKIIIAKKQP